MRVRFVGTLQVSLAIGPGVLRCRWVPLKGDADGFQLWLGPLGLGAHLLAKDPKKDQGTTKGNGPSPPAPTPGTGGPSPSLGSVGS